MRLPSHVLATLLAAGACEPAHETETCKSEPIVVEDSSRLGDVVRLTNEHRPAVAPKPLPPPPKYQPSPSQPAPPVVLKKPKPRMVWASICGHSQLVDEKAMLMRCGKG